ncbi:uncharacterized protein LOC119573535 [Penaeus monodon]|uniref:uncharacterized protein LOC119573535 n=1 Tax=Penaeus monodon TaxID=6687 RepID=UPI0018A73789|nr:uncharacterized protein LOC119573535 [Penaeus monodon]
MQVPYTLSIGLPQRFRVEGYTRFPDNDKGRLRPLTGYVTVNIQSLECFDDLNLGDVTLMPPCLFTASTAVDADHSPDHARLSSSRPWAPRVSPEAQWVQVDMVNQHRVTRLRHLAHPGYQQAATIAVMISGDGILWRRAGVITLPEQTEVFEHQFQAALEARYFRFIMKTWSGGSNLSGFRFDLRGCPLGSDRKPEDVCSTPVWPSASATVFSGRHFAVDTINNVVYTCEQPVGRNVTQCFYSSDNAVSWSRTPPFVTTVLGFWPEAIKVYGTAASPVDGLFFTSDMGLTWTPTTQVDLDTANRVRLKLGCRPSSLNDP